MEEKGFQNDGLENQNDNKIENEIKEEEKKEEEKKEENNSLEIENENNKNDNNNNTNLNNIIETVTQEQNENSKDEIILKEDNNNSIPNNKVLITEVGLNNLNQRKNYLNEKLKNFEISDNLRRGVSTGIIKTKDNIKKDFIDFKIDVKKKPNNINSLLESKEKTLSKETLKHLKQLKVSEENTKGSLKKLEINRKLILEESQKGIKGGIVEENIRKAKITSIEDKQKVLERKLENINLQVENILDNNKPSKKELIENFLENLEKNKNEYKLKVKEYEKKHNEMLLKMQKDKLITSEKREKEFKQKEKEDLEKKEKLFQERKEKEKQIILKRKKEINDKMEKTKQHIKDKFDKTERDYLYGKYKEQFELKEQQLIDRVNMQKKEFITLDEIKELSNKMKEQKEIFEQETKEKTNQLHEMWNNRSQILPNFKSKISKICEEENKENDYKFKKDKIALLEKEKQEYSKNIPQPLINPKLKKLRECHSIKIDKESVLLTEKNNRKRNELFFVPPPKKKNILTLSNEIERNHNEILDEDDINNLLNKRNKKFLKPIQILHPKPEKPINYLEELIKNRQNNENKVNKKKRIKINFNNTEIQTGNNVIEQIDMIKAQTDALENEVKQKKEYMKLNGGYQKNPLMGDELGDMLIESIHAKLNVINQLK